ncbi:hypothetical protein KAU32_03425, partial [bacterium]|nr:hypothetical protein [bacterium]
MKRSFLLILLIGVGILLSIPTATNLPVNRNAYFYSPCYYDFVVNDIKDRHKNVLVDFMTCFKALGYKYKEFLCDVGEDYYGDPNQENPHFFRITKLLQVINNPKTGVLLLESHGMNMGTQGKEGIIVSTYYCTLAQMEQYIDHIHTTYKCQDDEIYYEVFAPSPLPDDYPDYKGCYVIVTSKFIRKYIGAIGRNSIVIGSICRGAILKDAFLSNTKVTNYFASSDTLSLNGGDFEMFDRNIIRMLTGHKVFGTPLPDDFLDIPHQNYTCSEVGKLISNYSTDYHLYSNSLVSGSKNQTVYNAPK